MKKILSAALAFTMTFSPMSAVSAQGAENNVKGLQSADSLIDAAALPVVPVLPADVHETADDSSSCSYDLDTGMLTLKGNVKREDIEKEVNKIFVYEIKAEEGTVLPEDCSYLFNRFERCEKIDLSKADTSKVKNMSYMFSKCSDLSELDLSGFDTSNVTDMNSMFSGCIKLKSLDLSSFNTSKVTNMLLMFFECSSIQTLDLSSFDTSNINNMTNMFCNCCELKTVDLSSFDTSNVMYMKYMFFNCDKLEKLDLSNFKTGKLLDAGSMFEDCDRLTYLDMSSFDTSKVNNAECMFMYCKSLKELKLGENFKELTEEYKLQNNYPWSNADDPTAVVSGDGYYAVIQNTGSNTYVCDNKEAYDEAALAACYSFDSETGEFTIKGNFFKDAVKSVDATLIKSIKAEKGTVLPENSGELFANLTQCTKIDLSEADTSNVKDMSYMFMNCSNLKSLDISSFDTSNVIDMSAMFCQCSNLTELDLSNFDTSNVLYMPNVFYNCESLKSVDLSSFDTSSVTDMSAMFSGCSSFETLDISSFDTSQVTDMKSMFSGCSSLKKLDLSNFDTRKVTEMEDMLCYNASLSELKLGNLVYCIPEDAALNNDIKWKNAEDPSTVVSGNGGFAKIINTGDTTYIRNIDEEEEETDAGEAEKELFAIGSTKATVTANASEVDYDNDTFFIVCGEFSPTMEAGGYVQLRWFNKDKVPGVEWDGGVKVIWREAPSDLEYGDIIVPDGEISMTLLDSSMSVYPSSYYWDIDSGAKLKKVGNCADLFEQKELTATHFDYLAHQWYGMDYSDGEKTYRYSENYFGSSVKVMAASGGLEGSKAKFVVYGDKLLLPIEVNYPDREEDTTDETTTTTTTTSTTTTTTTEETTTTTTSETTTTTEETTTATTTSETTTTTEETTTTTTTSATTAEENADNFFAPISSWGQMAILDYEARKGIKSADSVTKENSDGTYSIVLKDDKGEEIATYTIDPKTGQGTADNGEAVDLPQTGNNSAKTAAALGLSVLLTMSGALAIYGSGMIRRKKEEE